MTSRVQRDSNGDYHISSNLVHLLIVAVIGMMFTIVVSILVWWHDEGSWRSHIDGAHEVIAAKQESLEKRLGVVEAELSTGVTPGADARLKRLEAEIDSIYRRK